MPSGSKQPLHDDQCVRARRDASRTAMRHRHRRLASSLSILMTCALFAVGCGRDTTIAATAPREQLAFGSANAVGTAGPSAVCGQPNGTVVTHSVNVSANETWAGAGVTHRIPNSISLTGTAVVTIQPCAIVALAPGVSITVRDFAKLLTTGTSQTNFVVFRRDNPNQAWGTLRGYHPTSMIDLNWTLLTGGGAFGGLSNPTIAIVGNGYSSPVARVLRVNGVRIDLSQGVGIYLDANAALTTDSKLLEIKRSGSRPVETTMMGLGSLPPGNYVTNAIDEILIHGPSANVFADMTVKDTGVPVRIPYSTMYVGPISPSTTPVTLTLKPGVVFLYPRIGGQPGARVTFGTNGSPTSNVIGILNAVGTAAKRIVFTSGEAAPAPGDWVGIWLNTANGSRLDYVDITYAGAASGIVSNNCRPNTTLDRAALLVGDFSDQYIPPSNLITNSRIEQSAYFGINAMWLTSTFNTPNLTVTNTIQNNALGRQTYNGVLPPGTCPPNGGYTVP